MSGHSAIEAIAAPVLLMQGNPRQVVGANRRALALFGKELHEVAGRRGGEVFDCIHAFTPAGCGQDANCEHCKIKNAIVATFAGGKPQRGVSTTLQIRSGDGIKVYEFQVATEKHGELAVVSVARRPVET